MPAVPSEDQHERHEPSQTQMLKDRRFKLNRACDRCRRRRIRCEESTPCASCVAAGSPCTFEEPGKKSHPHKSKRTSTLEERMAQLEALIQSMPANIFQGTAGGGFEMPMPSSATSEFAPTPFPPLAPFPTLGVPPFSQAKLMNPATHFVPAPPMSSSDSIAPGGGNVTISPTYLYWDDEGFTRWQGAASGLPLLDLLVEQSAPTLDPPVDQKPSGSGTTPTATVNTSQNYFPDRPLKRRVTINPETLWKTVTSAIPPDLMDGLVQSYLSTTFYLMPFLHIPTFLHDYSNPTKWGEPGFVSFVTAICCLASRHVDDKRVREDANDPFSSGTHWFGLFNRLRSLPSADRPTLYTVQAVLVAAVYAVGLGRLSKGFALLSEAVTLSIDAGLHRSVDAYDCFDPVEREVRKRTFWAVYMWDKQVGAAFGRPPMIRLRDCDVPEPSVIDDESMGTPGSGAPSAGAGAGGSVGVGGAGTSPRMSAYVAAIRYYVVLESVLDAPPALNPTTSNSSFLSMASMTLVGFRRNQDMHEEEALLDEAVSMVPVYWTHAADGSAISNGTGEDVIQTTQTHRLHCMEQWVRMLIHRQRLTVAITNGADEEMQIQEMIGCHQAAVNIIHSQLQMATHGLMGFFGVGAIHQLNQAGRTLVAVLLSCRSSSPFLQSQLVEPGLEALRSCVVLLRRFSVRYLCGLRSADLIEEFCRISKVPLDAPPFLSTLNNPAARRAWLRPIRKKTTSIAGSGTSPSDSGSPSNLIGSTRDSSQTRDNDTSLGSINMGISPTTTNNMQNLSLNSTSPGTFSGAAYDAYEALINPPGSSNPSSSSGMSGMGNNSMNGTSSYDQMNGADLLNGAGTEDILALLGNSNFEQPFDFGMLYSTDGNPVGGDTGTGMFGSAASPMGFGTSGSGSGSGLYDSKDRNGQNFKMGTV